MNSEAFNQKMIDFQKKIDQLPPAQQEQIAEMVNETKLRYEQITKTSNRLEHAVRDLMIQSTYQRFDIEATRRENIILKKQIELLSQEQDDQTDDLSDQN